MAIKKIRMRPESTNDYADVLHPETSADQVKISSGGTVEDLKTDLGTHLADDANPHSTNKTHVGLSNVTNDKQMPIKGGVLESYREMLSTVSEGGQNINLNLGNVFQDKQSVNMTYTITNAVNRQAHSFTLIITQTATVRTITFPSSIKWQGGEIPDLSTASKTYVLTFMTVDGGTAWLGMSGGEF